MGNEFNLKFFNIMERAPEKSGDYLLAHCTAAGKPYWICACEYSAKWKAWRCSDIFNAEVAEENKLRPEPGRAYYWADCSGVKFPRVEE